MLTVRVYGDDGVGRRAVLVNPAKSRFQRDALAPVFLVGISAIFELFFSIAILR